MTRRSKRELERAVADLEEEQAPEDPAAGGYNVTAEWVDYDTDPDPDADVHATYRVVMERDRAEREDREILGPAEGPGDLVEIASEQE